ncbi:restriction endonuclease subunit S [Microcystis aeruginosa CS-564/01]|uniref:restriction endonuclease subunit S n=1 Tax=Microcystis aeruginosa TaxID=1126 RepID=UPI0023311E92|nr:restriction endonuclease subunit S [Microcystis aeruginosa]MDB9425115.1 restriction endonuclease subunit S [Microcystis aeruginosa CS-564/01]
MKLNKKYIALNNLIILQRGFDLPEIQRVIGNIPVVASTGIIGSHNIAKVKGPGVVIGRSGSIGGGQYVAGDFWPLNTTLWVKDFKEHNPRFIYYVLKNIDFSRFNFGTGVPTLNRNHIANIKVLAFDKSQEEKIADILSKYDDLIENNRRRIELLERSARLLYKEWFVRLRFPGHEHTPIIDGIPEGWEKVRLKDIADLTMGQSPESEYYNEDRSGLPFHQGVTNFGIRFPENKVYCAKITRIANEGDILFSVRAPVGRMNISLEKIIIGRGLAAIRAKHNYQGFLYYHLKNYFFKEDMIGSGVIFASVTKAGLENVQLIKPKDSILAIFLDKTTSIDEQIKILFRQNQKLKQARDILLPKLMNGEIEV